MPKHEKERELKSDPKVFNGDIKMIEYWKLLFMLRMGACGLLNYFTYRDSKAALADGVIFKYDAEKEWRAKVALAHSLSKEVGAVFIWTDPVYEMWTYLECVYKDRSAQADRFN